MKITKETIKRFEAENKVCLYFSYGARCYSKDYKEWIRDGDKIEDALWVQVLGWDEDDKYISFGFKPPKNKEVTFDYLMHKLSSYYTSSSSWRNLRDVFEKLLPSLRGRFYATSYGVGFDTFMMSHEDVMKATDELRQWLEDKGIEFTNEYSDAAWVYRFRIGRSVANLRRINEVLPRANV